MESLYFIAIVPPANIQEEIHQLKLEIAERYGSTHALNAPPHITLHMPFTWKDKRFAELAQLIQDLNARLQPFDVCLKNFDFFEPRVVFVNVLANELLHQLQSLVATSCRRLLKITNADYKNRPFHPHVTIGFRDLKKRMFYEAKKEFEERDYSCEFSVDRIELLKHKEGKWELISF